MKKKTKMKRNATRQNENREIEKKNAKREQKTVKNVNNCDMEKTGKTRMRKRKWKMQKGKTKRRRRASRRCEVCWGLWALICFKFKNLGRPCTTTSGWTKDHEPWAEISHCLDLLQSQEPFCRISSSTGLPVHHHECRNPTTHSSQVSSGGRAGGS